LIKPVGWITVRVRVRVRCIDMLIKPVGWMY
jgi:hypothetical protein